MRKCTSSRIEGWTKTILLNAFKLSATTLLIGRFCVEDIT
jgi:hypothetical protein